MSRSWAQRAIANGGNPLYKIALCGYSGEHAMPDGWECFRWKAKGGMAAKGSRAEANAARETIWFSPHCEQRGLF